MKEMLITLLFPRRCPVCGEIVPGISGVRGGALPPLENLICPECIDSLSPVGLHALRKRGDRKPDRILPGLYAASPQLRRGRSVVSL